MLAPVAKGQWLTDPPFTIVQNNAAGLIVEKDFNGFPWYGVNGADVYYSGQTNDIFFNLSGITPAANLDFATASVSTRLIGDDHYGVPASSYSMQQKINPPNGGTFNRTSIAHGTPFGGTPYNNIETWENPFQGSLGNIRVFMHNTSSAGSGDFVIVDKIRISIPAVGRKYRLEWLPSGTTDLFPNAISDSGIVVGQWGRIPAGIGPRAFLWSQHNGTLHLLPQESGWPFAFAEDISEAGVVIGASFNGPSNNRQPTLWQTDSSLPMRFAAPESTTANVAGRDYAWVRNESGSNPATSGFIVYSDPTSLNWLTGLSFTPIGLLTNLPSVVVGSTLVGGLPQACVGLSSTLLPRVPGESASEAVGGHETGFQRPALGGNTVLPSGKQAVIWKKPGSAFVATLLGHYKTSTSTTVNDAAGVWRFGSNNFNFDLQLVGSGLLPGNQFEAFTWDESTGFSSLQSKVVGTHAGERLETALAMNRFGQIVGTTHNGVWSRGYILTPTDRFQMTGLLLVRGLNTTAYAQQWGPPLVEVSQNSQFFQPETMAVTNDGDYQTFVSRQNLSEGSIEVICTARYCLRRIIPASLNSVGCLGLTIELIPGDLNEDNEVGPADFALFAPAFGSFGGDPNYFGPADFNGDNEIGPADFAVFAAAFGEFGD